MKRVWLALYSGGEELPASMYRRAPMDGEGFVMSADAECGCPVLSNAEDIGIVIDTGGERVEVTGFKLVGAAKGPARAYTEGDLSRVFVVEGRRFAHFARGALSFHLGH